MWFQASCADGSSVVTNYVKTMRCDLSLCLSRVFTQYVDSETLGAIWCLGAYLFACLALC